ncbi:hypothetical protein FRB96_007069 [Tulasnella sp. 330]|nr:hypothetical protein FRB96_007069 [Tulasnella sp. 330]KAG8875783.1 hypothetical protein FRB97_004723 [Tulasnella sp. 331]KAG8887055.1 hypothetical protein FRB98_000634 [Tulasnella sp. 332]
MATSSSPITQVSQHAPAPMSGLQPQLLTRLTLDLRGQKFSVDRETIMNLPESVLLCLFPNGLVLSRQSTIDGGESDEEEDVYAVDFDPQCFSFVLSFFRQAQDTFYGTSTFPGLYQAQQHLIDPASAHPPSDFSASQNPLLTKQAIIVLREELEYFSIPPKGDKAKTTAEPTTGQPSELLIDLKKACGTKLLEKKSIFTALQRNVSKENNLAEQHLIDMLCMSGFEREDVWGYRALEPNRCCISSIALVLLKTGISHSNPSDPTPAGVSVDNQQMGTAQKLLLFWRKPARKCWWDGLDVDIALPGESARVVKLWSRRVWTLELSLI